MLQNRIPPPVLTLALAAAMWFSTEVGPAPWWRLALAIVVFAGAGMFGLPAVRAFRQADTTIDPVRIDRATALVTGGIFGISRNPMYLSLTMMLIAWAIWLGEPWVWAGPIVLVLWLDRFQIRPEERAMAARFGTDYHQYRQRVRRWL